MSVKCNKCGGTGYINQTNLAAARRRAGLTQEQVSRHIGVGRAGYAMIESGKANFTADKILPLSQILKVSVDEVLTLIYGDAV
jgi:transcriptional regulator with XRE-family HTH domain